MAYVPNPQDPTQPTNSQLAGNMAAELRALKGYIQTLVSSGTNWAYVGAYRNRLKNGAMNVAQRGTSVSVAAGTPAYTLDQWRVSATGAGATVTQGTGGYSANSSYMQLTVTIGNTDLNIQNRIESQDCQDFLSGTSITVSGLYYVGALGAGLPNLSLLTPTAVDNWASSTVVGTSVAMSISPQIAATYQFFSQTFVLSADATGGLALQIDYPSGIPSQTVRFQDIQLEVGSQYTIFERRPAQVELALCQRYYSVYTLNTAAYTTVGSLFGEQTPYNVAMRVAPTYTISGTVLSSASTLTIATSVTSYIPYATCTLTGPCSFAGVAAFSAEL